MEILHLENISFTYPNSINRAVDNFSLSVKSGEFVVVCGKSGCGKTTLLRLIKKEIAPHGDLSGGIFYKGIPLNELDPKISAREIGFVQQNPDSQLVTDKVWHELAFGLENLNVPSEEMRLRVGEISDYFGIHNWFYRDVNTLSGGQKQLVNLAAAMVMQPEILLLDEPTSQLDPIAAADFISILEKLNKELGITLILAEHRLEELFPIADRIVLMDSGRQVINCDPRSFGEKLKNLNSSEFFKMLPSSVRIFNGVNVKARCPLTVKEGREFLQLYFKKDIKDYIPPQRQEPDQTALQLKNVWFRYERDSQDVLKNLNLTLKYGELLCVLGTIGSGKTTMLNVAAGVANPYKGHVLFEGKRIGKKNSGVLEAKIAYLPQNAQLMFVKDSIIEDYYDMLSNLGISEKAQERIAATSEKLGVNDLLDKHPYDLSIGQLQKCALAKLLMLEPKILLLDEPTMGLDAGFKQVLADILKNKKAEGTAILMVTHDVEFAAEHADRCALFFDGGIISVGAPEEFFLNNYFYTTAANRISRHMYNKAITCSAVIEMCLKNGVRNEKD